MSKKNGFLDDIADIFKYTNFVMLILVLLFGGFYLAYVMISVLCQIIYYGFLTLRHTLPKTREEKMRSSKNDDDDFDFDIKIPKFPFC